MSRIGNKPIPILDGVKVSIVDGVVLVEGPKGKLQLSARPEVKVTVAEDGKSLAVTRGDDERFSRAVHGLTRSLINNMVVGVKDGYEKKLEVVGVGYLCNVKGK
ncbi:MAG: 50S ribosomal protein L6, partial [Pirellulaceae bacterium]